VLDVRETVILFGHCDDSIIAFPHFLIALLAFNDSDEPTLQNTMQEANSSLRLHQTGSALRMTINALVELFVRQLYALLDCGLLFSSGRTSSQNGDERRSRACSRYHELAFDNA
jgi:hypothetical protein